MRGQRVDQLPVVHREFGDRPEAMPDALGQQRFDVARGRRQRHGMALRGQPVADGAQVGGVGAVHGDDEGFVRRHHIRR